MKKLFSLMLFFLMTLAALAQEGAQPLETGRADTGWSLQVKIYLLIAMSVLTIFFAVRTFRNKPEA